jgi:hypothetical protein
MLARCAAAAGLTSLLANALLVAFYALELGRSPVGPVSLGTANDVVGSVSAALMIPLAVAWGPRWLRCLGGAATTVLTAAGPLLVSGALRFDQQLPIALAGALGLAAWLVLVGQHQPVSSGTARLGVLAGGTVLVGVPVVGVGLLLPPMSWAQLAVFGLGGLPGVVGWLATPFWFLRLARDLRSESRSRGHEPRWGRLMSPAHRRPGESAGGHRRRRWHR